MTIDYSSLGQTRTKRTITKASGPYGTSSYSSLLRTVRDAGLLTRRRSFYITLFLVLLLALGGAGTGFVILGDSWFQLIIAGVLGIILTQFAFLAHEASHRQIFESGPANDHAGRILSTAFLGISHSWWMNKHTRHHAHPNEVGKDPDIEVDTISFLKEDAAKRTGFMAALTRRQGYLFFPLLMLEGINLHVTSIRTLFSREPVEKRTLQLVLIALRLSIYVTVIFLFLPVGMAFAFIGVQLAVFGVYMGASFAPNHKGMPIIPEGSKVDFLSRQVLTSRNIRGGFGMDLFMGGLNYQVEHHLFPNMPRPHLAKASRIVKDYCRQHNIPYTEASLMQSYGIVVQYLNRVGLAARDPFACPMTSRFRR